MRWLGLLLPLLVVGCEPDLTQLSDALPPPDARQPPDGRPPIDSPPPDASCREAVPVGDLIPGAGHHYPGQRCTYGCHDGNNGPAFHFGGTIYVNYSGQAPRPGVTISVIDAMGRQYETIAQDNGNFWLPATAGPLNFPLRTWASDCPLVDEMELPTPDPGDCNDPVDPPFRIRLPPI